MMTKLWSKFKIPMTPSAPSKFKTPLAIGGAVLGGAAAMGLYSSYGTLEKSKKPKKVILFKRKINPATGKYYSFKNNSGFSPEQRKIMKAKGWI